MPPTERNSSWIWTARQTSALGSNAQAVLTDQKSGEFHCRVWQENLKKLNYKRTKTQVSCTTKDNVSTHCPDFRYSAPKTPAPVPKAEVEAAPAQLHTRNNTSVRYSLLHATMGYSDSTNSCQSRSFRNKTRWISFIYSKNFKISINRNIFMPVFFCMGVKLGRSCWRTNVGRGCSRTELWGEYLGLRGTR